jgi:hypothetical protein
MLLEESGMVVAKKNDRTFLSGNSDLKVFNGYTLNIADVEGNYNSFHISDKDLAQQALPTGIWPVFESNIIQNNLIKSLDKISYVKGVEYSIKLLEYPGAADASLSKEEFLELSDFKIEELEILIKEGMSINSNAVVFSNLWKIYENGGLINIDGDMYRINLHF